MRLSLKECSTNNKKTKKKKVWFSNWYYMQIVILKYCFSFSKKGSLPEKVSKNIRSVVGGSKTTKKEYLINFISKNSPNFS